MPKRNVKYGLSLLFRDYLVVSATMMGNIYIYMRVCVCVCIYIYMNSVEWEWGNH